MWQKNLKKSGYMIHFAIQQKFFTTQYLNQLYTNKIFLKALIQSNADQLFLSLEKNIIIVKLNIKPSNFPLVPHVTVTSTSQILLIQVTATFFRRICRIRISLISSQGRNYPDHSLGTRSQAWFKGLPAQQATYQGSFPMVSEHRCDGQCKP